jgi:very-short-patch-repair endonuclease
MNKAERYPLVLPMLLSVSPDAVAEFKFHPSRKWRADFAMPGAKILIEIDGGVWSGGRHTRGSGFIGDMEKLNAAACLGYRVLRYTPQDCKAKRITLILAQVMECRA